MRREPSMHQPAVIFLLGVSFAVACSFADVLPLWARIAGFWIASALIILAGGLWLWPRLPLWLTPSMGFMPMREAATRTYERTLHSPVAEIFRRFASAPEELLVDYANLIRDTGIPLYGKRAPSRRFEMIPKEEYRRLQFTKDASGLRPIGILDPVEYTEVAIGRRDLGRAIRAIEREARADLTGRS
jgi:hypothetical protein